MKKTTLVLAALLTLNVASKAQVTDVDKVKGGMLLTNKDTVAWMHGATINIGVAEGYSHSWYGGGEAAALNVSGIYSGHYDRYYHRSLWTNNLDLQYALNYAFSTSFIPHKSNDLIDFTSKYGYRINPKKDFFLAALLNYKSQMTKGFNYANAGWMSNPISEFNSPGVLTLALGVEYRKDPKFSIFFSPLAAKLTMVKSKYTTYSDYLGVAMGKTSKFELGAYLSARYQTDLAKNISYKTRMDFYMNYLAKNTTDANGFHPDNPGNIDWLWDNQLNLKVNEYIGVAIGLTFLYDNDHPYNSYLSTDASGNNNSFDKGLGMLQIKQGMTIGFQYKFH